jgi:hypothetical protein
MPSPVHQPPVGRRPALRPALAEVLLGALLGGLAGFAIGLLVYPYLPLGRSDGAGSRTPRTGALWATAGFVQADPTDRLRYGSGSASVFEHLVLLGDDFAVGPGPKYHLYLAPSKGVDPDTRIEESMFVDLGPLQAFAGAQEYPIPAGVDVRGYGSLAVWSEQLNLLISPAELRTAP